MKKTLCILAGVVLILAGCYGLLNVSLSGLLLSALLIGAGGWLCSFKRAAWRFAVIIYGILLVYLVFLNITGYFIALNLSYSGDRPNPFSLINLGRYVATGVGIVFQGLLLLCGAFMYILLVSREQFKN